jgi:hypothetical protein
VHANSVDRLVVCRLWQSISCQLNRMSPDEHESRACAFGSRPIATIVHAYIATLTALLQLLLSVRSSVDNALEYNTRATIRTIRKLSKSSYYAVVRNNQPHFMTNQTSTEVCNNQPHFMTNQTSTEVWLIPSYCTC